ncbi:MAG: hypothetical protein ACXW32_07130 [Limisphaerales bacterium]
MISDAANERIAALDVLRGAAVLGILLMNIQSFSMVSSAYFNPLSHGDFSGANAAVWAFTRLFADQKFMTLFSMLFGAGIVLMSERTAASGRRPWAAHYRRMIVYWLWDSLMRFCFGTAMCSRFMRSAGWCFTG